MNRFSIVTFFCLVLLFPFAVSAENSTTANGYTVHHNVFKADFLTPEIATQYGFQRSKFRGMLNVSVIQNVPGTIGVPVAALVEVEAADLMQKPKNIELKEIREGAAVYYIGDFPVIDRDMVNFKLKVTPEGESSYISSSFSHEFYID